MKNEKRFVLVLFVFVSVFLSCQTNMVVFKNSDFEKLRKYNEWVELGEIPLIVDFQEAHMKHNIFVATGHIYSGESKEALKGVTISIENGTMKKILYETKNDGYFSIKIEKFSTYDILRFSLISYVMEYYKIEDLLKEKR